MYVCYICQIILLGLNTKTIMKTKLILILCALMGVLSTVQATIYTTTRVNDSTLSINRASGSNSGLILNDSAHYNTLKLSGVWDSLSVRSLIDSYQYDSTITHLDMTNMTSKLSRTYDFLPKPITNIFQMGVIMNYRYIKTVCLPSTTDTIYSAFGGKLNYITLDTVTVTNQISVMYVKLSGPTSTIAYSFGNRYVTYNLIEKDSIVLRVPRPLYKGYKAIKQYTDAFKIIPYDVPVTSDVQVTTNNNIKIYPTIATDVVNVTGIESDKNISLIDLSGNVVLSPKGETQLNVSSLSKGMYLVSVDGKVIQKIIKK